VAGEIWVRIVVRQFQSRDEDEAVRRERARPLALDLRAVFVEPLFVDARASVQRRPRVVGAQHVVGDAEDVEPRAAVEVDYLRYRKLTVAPRGVSVELTEEGRRASTHLVHSVRTSLCQKRTRR